MAKHNAEKSEKKLVSRREFLVGGGAIIATVALAACTSKIANTTTSTTTPKLNPKYGGTLRMFGISTNNIGWPAEYFQFSGLIGQYYMEILLRGDNKGNIIPWLAESYKVADDQRSITFNLRKGVKFHDGSDFNAEVAKWNLDNYINTKVYPYWASVDVIDEYTIRVNLTQWQGTVLTSFVEPTNVAWMVSKAAFDKHGIEWMRRNPVGTGPFKVESFTPDVSLKLVRNPDYWLKGKPYLDGIEINFVADTMTQKMLLKAGQVDIGEITVKDMSDFAALGFTLKTIPANIVSGLVPDTANPDSPWANQKVREAVEFAIDKEGIAKAFGYGYWQAPYQIPPRGASLAYNSDFTLGRKFDLNKAKQLLAEAGYSNGFETTFIVMPIANKSIIIALQDNLAKVGIKVNLDFPDMGKWAASYMTPKATWHNAALYYIIPAIGGLDYAAGLQFIFNNLGQSWLRLPELNEAYQAYFSSPTLEIEKVRAVTDMITKEALIIPVNEEVIAYAMRPGVVANFGERSKSAFYNVEDWWLNK